MISGFLLLRKEYNINEFFKKRLNRVVLPFIFWNIIYIFIKIRFQNPLNGKTDTLSIISYFVNGFLDPTIITVQFWFVYMILALYLITPILSKWIKNANDKNIQYFLVIWFVILLLNFFNIDFLLIEYLGFFTGFIGYFILGYYLGVKDNKYTSNPKLGLLLFVLGSLGVFIGTYLISNLSGEVNYTFLRVGELTPFTAIQGVGMFIFLKNINTSWINNGLLGFIIEKISVSSFGIYLVNILVINFMILVGFYSIGNFGLYFIPIYLFIVLVVSFIIVNILSRIPFLDRFSGLS